MSRYFATDPHEVRLSVSAVVWRDGEHRELLLMQRSDNSHWGLPGGYVEPGESIDRATAREVREETGVQVEVGRLIGVYSDPAIQVIAYPDGRRVHAVNLCFEAEPIGVGSIDHAGRGTGHGLFCRRRSSRTARSDPPSAHRGRRRRGLCNEVALARGASDERSRDQVHLRDGRRALVARQGPRLRVDRRPARSARPARLVPEARSHT